MAPEIRRERHRRNGPSSLYLDILRLERLHGLWELVLDLQNLSVQFAKWRGVPLPSSLRPALVEEERNKERDENERHNKWRRLHEILCNINY